MEYYVIVRTARGITIETHECETPMDGLSWLASQFQAQKCFGDAAVARCWYRAPSAADAVQQWELKVN
jgi:hypothetical protein